MSLELENAIQSGQYCVKQLYRMFPDLSTHKIDSTARDLGLVYHKKRVREEFYHQYKDAVRKPWVEGIKDPEISKNVGISLWDVKAVRVRFGFINDVKGDLVVKRKYINQQYAAGWDDKSIAAELSKMLGEDVTEAAVRSFRYRENILYKRDVKEYIFSTMEDLKPLFVKDCMASDGDIARKSGYCRNTVTKYRRIFMKQLLEKAAL